MLLVVLLLAPLAKLSAADAAKVLPVDSPALVFSPGNWVGDNGRAGAVYRQTWNPGAYVRITWETPTGKVAPTLLLDTSIYPDKARPPVLACSLDGKWSGNLPCTREIQIPGMTEPGRHVLTVYLKRSDQHHRWGTPAQSGWNVVRLTGVRVDADSKPAISPVARPWALIVGDSITEGCGAYELEGYSHLVGQALRSVGYEYGISACGWSGWLHRGDDPPGDVPGYYTIARSTNGTGGQYDDANSRWNKIDAAHSLLDSGGHISAYGPTGQEPAVILINYGTNDAIHKTNPGDVRASMAQAIHSLRKAAPRAHLFILIPFGQYKAVELKQTVEDFQSAHPDDTRISIIDLGPDVARSLDANGYWGSLHPNARAHATLAAQITARMLTTLSKSKP